MKPLGLDVIHFRILTIVRLCFANVFGRFFRLKIVSLLSFWRENHSCISQRAVAFQRGPDGKKKARSESRLSQSDSFIFTDKK